MTRADRRRPTAHPPVAGQQWQTAAGRWLRRSGVPAFLPGHARPGAVLRRWPWALLVALLVATGVLVVAIVAGYGAEFRAAWPIVGLALGSVVIGVAAAAVGLPDIVLFTVRWFARTAWRSGAGMLRILPILLVALVFTFLSAETWQSIGTLTGTPLVLAAVLLLVLTVLPLLHSTDDDRADFTDGDAVRAALPSDLAAGVHAIPDVLIGDPSPPLTLTERINLRLIGTLGRALVAAVVGTVVAAFFLVFGVLTVRLAVASSWAGAPADVWWQFTVGTHRYALTAEHVRVAVFLGVFSALYLVVSASTDRQLAGALSADTQAHVQQCLAVRAAYRATEAASPSTSKGRTGRSRRTDQRPSRRGRRRRGR